MNDIVERQKIILEQLEKADVSIKEMIRIILNIQKVVEFFDERLKKLEKNDE